MANDLNGVIDARLEKVEQELLEISVKKKNLVAHLIPRENELAKERSFYLDLKREAGIIPPAKPKGNPNFGKKKPAE